MAKSKLGTARAVLFKEFNVKRSYTLEISVFGSSVPQQSQPCEKPLNQMLTRPVERYLKSQNQSSLNSSQNYHFSITDLYQLGKQFMITLFFLKQQNFISGLVSSLLSQRQIYNVNDTAVSNPSLAMLENELNKMKDMFMLKNSGIIDIFQFPKNIKIQQQKEQIKEKSIRTQFIKDQPKVMNNKNTERKLQVQSQISISSFPQGYLRKYQNKTTNNHGKLNIIQLTPECDYQDLSFSSSIFKPTFNSKDKNKIKKLSLNNQKTKTKTSNNINSDKSVCFDDNSQKQQKQNTYNEIYYMQQKKQNIRTAHSPHIEEIQNEHLINDKMLSLPKLNHNQLLDASELKSVLEKANPIYHIQPKQNSSQKQKPISYQLSPNEGILHLKRDPKNSISQVVSMLSNRNEIQPKKKSKPQVFNLSSVDNPSDIVLTSSLLQQQMKKQKDKSQNFWMQL